MKYHVHSICILFTAVLLTASAVNAQELVATELDPVTVQEIQYANILKGWGMPDLAMMVLNRIKDPAAQMKIKVIELESMIYMGKWAEVSAKIAAVPDQNSQEAWAMKLALADGYYAWGKYDEAQKIYDEFLAKYPGGPPEAIKEFFLNSSYKYAQMLILMGNKQGAIKAYEQLVAAKPPRAIARQVSAEMAEMMITLLESKADGTAGYREKLDKIIRDLFWVQDLWFSKAVVLRAHLQIMDGEIDKAMKIIDDYRPQLEEMDQILKEEEAKTGEPMSKLSPMAECRYLLATMMKKEADKLLAAGGDKEKAKELLVGKTVMVGKVQSRTDGALQHYLNVFLQYPNTPWAPDAGNEAKKLQEMLESEFGAKISVDVGPEQWAKVEKAQFQEARSLFNQNQHEQAIDAYLKVLNLFPESETGVAALGELSRCYVELKDDVMFDTTAHYLAERFGRHREHFIKAGDVTLQLAAYMKELGAPDKYDALMDIFFKKCPRHPSVAVMIMKRGDEKFLKVDYEGAEKDYRLVEEEHSDTMVYEGALNKRAMCLFEMDKKIEGIKTLTKYIELLDKKPVPDNALLNAKFRLAQMYRKLDKKYIPTAFKFYQEIVKLMDDEKNPVHETLIKSEDNQKVYMSAKFYMGLCYAMLDQPPQNVKAYRMQAIKYFEELVAKYPKTELAPQSLLRMASLYTALDDSDNAGKALKQLTASYPDTEEAKNASYMYATALMDMGKEKEAVKVYEEMFSDGGGKFTDQQILAAGMALQEAKRFEIALKAFEKLAQSKEQASNQRVLIGIGECYYETGAKDKAIEVLAKMLKDFPNTGHTPLAATILSKAYGDVAMEEPDGNKRMKLFNEAVKAEKTVRKYQKEDKDQKASDLRVGRILKKKAAAEEKFGDAETAKGYKGKAAASLQTIIMFSDAKNTALQGVIQDAYMESIPSMAELDMWREVMDACEKYMQDFPDGKYLSAIRSWRNKANVRLATADNKGAVEENLAEDVVPIEDSDRDDQKPAEEAVAPAADAAVPATEPAPAPEEKAAAVDAPAPVVEEPAPAATEDAAVAPVPAEEVPEAKKD